MGKTVGERIRELRGYKFSQQGLAEAMNVSSNTVWRWEAGQRIPDAENLLNLARVLNTTVAYLTGETDDPSSSSILISPDGEHVMMAHFAADGKAININGDVTPSPVANEKQDNKPWWPEALAKAYEMERDDPRLDEAITTIDMIQDVLKRARALRDATPQSVPA